jgi:putative ABC transport system permease protein
MLTEIRYAVRLMLRSPGFTLVTIVTLAIGIGASTAIFTLVNAALLRPLPYREPDRLVGVWERNVARGRDRNVVAASNFLRWRERSRTFAGMAAVATDSVTLAGQGEPEALRIQEVSAALFRVLGVEAATGRTFLDEEDRPEPDRLLISHRLWQRKFGADEAVLGRAVQIDGDPWTIVGVMPPEFSILDRDVDLWRPLGLSAAAWEPQGRSLRVVARIGDGVSLEEAQSEMEALAAALTQEFPDFNAGWSVTVVPLAEQVAGSVRPALLVLLGAVACLVLIGAANIASLLLTRATGRQREFAVRSALGASQRRLVRQLLVESLVLALAGGGAGLLVAVWATDILARVASEQLALPSTATIGVDGRVLVFALAVSGLTGLVFGMVPALAASRPQLVDTLKEAGRSSSGSRTARARKLFVVVEVALAFVLLAGAGLMIRSLNSLLRTDPGFRADQVLTMRVVLPSSQYPEEHRRVAFFQSLAENLERHPAFEAAGAVSFLPMTGLASRTRFWITDRPEPPAAEKPGTEVRVVSHQYFKAMGIPLVRGRLFDQREAQEAPRVLIVNETLARQYWPDEDPIGKRISISWDEVPFDTIVGVVGDVKHDALDGAPTPMVYWPHTRVGYTGMTVVMKTAGDPMALAGTAVGEVRALDRNQSVSGVRAMDEVLARSMARRRLIMRLLAGFAGVALLLAGLGIYGVMAYAMTERRYELGVRIALGAEPKRLIAMVVRQGLALAAVGIAAGLVTAAAVTRFLGSLLFDVSATDPLTFGAIGVLAAGVAILASYLPARRALRLDPMIALRSE